MNKKLFALASLTLTGALILGFAVMSSNRRATTMSADTFELSLNARNGAITTATYSSEIAYGTGKTTQGNTFRYSYKNAKRYNLKTGSGFAIIQANEGEIVSVDGVSGLLSIAAKVASDSAKLYVSFASSANSASWSDAVEIGSDPIESPQGMDFFKLTAPAGIVYCESVTVRYNCGGIHPDSSSSEQTSSQETSEEESTSIPGSSESQSSTSKSSSASSSQAPLSNVGTVTFDTSGGTSGADIDDMTGEYVADGISISDIDVTKAFVGGDGSVRLASSKAEGSLTLNLAEPTLVLGVTVHAKKYSSDSSSNLTVATSANQTGQMLNVINEGDYVFDSFSGATSESNWISLSVPNKNRIHIYSITIAMGVAEPVYPTAISLGDDFELGVNQSKKLSVTYTPSNTNVKEVSFQSEDESIATVDANGKVTAKAMGEAEIVATATAESGTVTDRVKVTVGEAPVLEKTAMKYNYSDYTANSCYELDSAPTIDTAKLLVIPVWFTDSTTFISTSKKETIREDIRKAYLGTEEETGWHSVKSFYETESAGRLTIEGTVSNWYECGKSYNTYGPSSTGGSATESLVTSAANWYFTNNPSESRQDYDRDGNGYLDGVLLIYAAPDFQSLDDDSVDNLWAYCYWLQDSGNNSKTNPGPNVFFWASYDFLYDSSTASSRTGKSSYGHGDNSHCTIDAHTFIHEMGHVFGLDDYYDYGDEYAQHAGGFSMQDYNVGGHDPFSVMAFGWADPYIPTDSCEITISAFQKNHDLILLTPEWNEFDSPWDEYFLLELYTPTGLNELDATYSYDKTPTGPSVPGIRLWHIDARLLYFTSENDNGSYSQLTSDVYDSRAKAGVIQAFTNTINDADYGSPLGSTYDKYNLLRLIRNDTSAPVHNKNFIDDSDLFCNGSSFDMSTYKSQFSNSAKMNKNVNLDWSFSVSITGTGNDAEATVTLTRA
ncbi:MAG: hypothetical protein E7182_05525 [Erysipelotrichaceae bacterium]|nr:hypothetical protein [Erysipelotrichaceae bacterium]